MAKDSIRISSGIKRIEVNDDGECICINVSDQSFIPRITSIYKNLAARSSEYEEEEKRISEMDANTQEAILKKLDMAAKHSECVHRDIMREIDDAFGDEVCRKVFGDVVPSVDMVCEFFEALAPYLQKYMKERNDKVRKYDPTRTGNG